MFLTKFYKIFKKLYVHKCAYWNEKKNSSLEINVTLIPTDFTPTLILWLINIIK